jgi:hypothetical protein
MTTASADTARRSIECALLLAIVLATAATTYEAGRRLGMARTLTGRHVFYSLPYAVSHRYFGTSGYVILRDVAELFIKSYPDVTNATLARSLALKPSPDRLMFIPGDDKGDADFAVLAFRLFGMRVESLYYLWFTMYVVGLVSFVVAFWGDEARLSALVLLTCAVYVGFFALPLTTELGSIHNPRAFGVVSVAGVLHLCFLMIDRQRPTLVQVVAAAVQAVLIAFSIDVRSTEWWQVLAIVGVAAWLVASSRVGLAWLWPSAALVVALLGWQVYQRAAVNEIYVRSALRGRVFWHNVGIGFALNPALAAKYSLSLDDLPMIQLVRRHLLEMDRPDEVERLFRPSGQEDYLYQGITKDFAGYERAARRVVLSIIWHNKYDALHTFVVDKPRVLARELIWAAGYGDYTVDDLYLGGQVSHLASDRSRAQASIYLAPFRPWVVGCLVAIAGLGRLATRRVEYSQAAILALWFFAISLLPSLLAYPTISAIGNVLFTVSFLILSALVWLVATTTTLAQRLQIAASPGVTRRRGGLSPR